MGGPEMAPPDVRSAPAEPGRSSNAAPLAASGRERATLGEAVTIHDRRLFLGRDDRGIVAAAVLKVGAAHARSAGPRREAVQRIAAGTARRGGDVASLLDLPVADVLVRPARGLMQAGLVAV